MKNDYPNQKTPAIDDLFAGLKAEKTSGKTFDEYNRLYPEIWHEFQKLAFSLIRKGRTHYGARCLVEVIRYHRDLEYTDRDFKINNNYVTDYARKFAAKYPAHKNFFSFRVRKYERGKNGK